MICPKCGNDCVTTVSAGIKNTCNKKRLFRNRFSKKQPEYVEEADAVCRSCGHTWTVLR